MFSLVLSFLWFVQFSLIFLRLADACCMWCVILAIKILTTIYTWQFIAISTLKLIVLFNLGFFDSSTTSIATKWDHFAQRVWPPRLNRDLPRGSLTVHARKGKKLLEDLQYIRYLLLIRSTADPIIGAGKQSENNIFGNKIFSVEHGISVLSSNMKESRNWFLQFAISRTEKR